MPRRRAPLRFHCFKHAAWTAVAFAAAGCSPGDPRPEPPAATRIAIERGQKLLAQYQCGSCHTIPGVPSARGQATASFQGFGQRSYIAGRLVNGPETLAQWIMRPDDMVPGTAMPSMGVSQGDARNMAAYLLDLR